MILKIEVKDLWAEKEQKEEEEAGEDVDMPESQQTRQGGSEGSASETPAESVPSSTIAEQGSVASSNTTSTASSVVSSPSVSHAQFKPKKSIDPTRVVFVVRGSIAGHVMELNERLIRRGTDVVTDPEVIETMLDKVRFFSHPHSP